MANQLLWIGIYFGIAIVVGIFLDFPISLIVIIAIIIPLSLYRRRQIMKRMGGQQGTGSFFGGIRGGGGGGMFGSKGGLSYYCISCGTKHNQAECPKCGSRMKRAAFDS